MTKKVKAMIKRREIAKRMNNILVMDFKEAIAYNKKRMENEEDETKTESKS